MKETAPSTAEEEDKRRGPVEEEEEEEELRVGRIVQARTGTYVGSECLGVVELL